MKPPVIFFHNEYTDSNDILINEDSILLHGEIVDDRGSSAVNIKNPLISERVLINYNCEEMLITVGKDTLTADKANELFIKYFSKKIILEATTLGFPELFFAIKSLIDLKVNDFLIIYVEPEEYNRTDPSADSFALTELNSGYKPIPNAIIDLTGSEVEAGVFFLGYESDRLERAFEEYQMIASKDLKVVFGIPAFQPGWELNSIIPHLDIIGNISISYCAANDPSSAFDVLEETRLSLTKNNKMFVAPIGTKPCGIAAAIYSCIYPSQVGLLYDHRKKKAKRSEGTSISHRYAITIRQD